MRRGPVIFLVVIMLLAAALFGAFFLLPGGTVPGIGAQQGDQPTPEATEVPRVPVVVSVVEIPAGTIITDTVALLEVQERPENQVDVENSFTNQEELRDQLVVNTVGFDQVIRRSDITEPGLSQRIPPAEPGEPRDKAYPLQVDSLRGVADQIRPNDVVDVIMSFTIIEKIYFPDPQNPEGAFFTEDIETESTKTLIQQAQVLQVIYPRQPAPVEGDGSGAPPPGDTAEGGDGSPPPTDESGRPISASANEESNIRGGEWIVVLAVNNQEAEILDYARYATVEGDNVVAAAPAITLVLRGAGDDQVEETSGVTIDILIEDFGLPVLADIAPDDLTP